MKYTIELTNKQKAQMDCIISIVRRYVGFNPELEPVEYSSESEVEKYGIQAYNKGFEDGKKWAIDENAKDHQGYYDKGYEQGIADYRKFERFFDSDGIEMFEDIRNTDGTLSLEMILLYLPMSEIMARIKAYEEKKKAEEEIKVGDVIYSQMTDSKAVVISFNAWNDWNCIDNCGTGFVIKKIQMGSWKKIGHIDNVEEILDKLRGEE